MDGRKSHTTLSIDADLMRLVRAKFPDHNLSALYEKMLRDLVNIESSPDLKRLVNQYGEANVKLIENKLEAERLKAELDAKNRAEIVKLNDASAASHKAVVNKSRMPELGEKHQYSEVFYDPVKIPQLIRDGVIKGSVFKADAPEGYEYTGRLNWLGRAEIKEKPEFFNAKKEDAH